MRALSTLRAIMNAMLGKVPGKPDRLDTTTGMAMDADFSGSGGPSTSAREPSRGEVDQIDELMHTSLANEAQTSHRMANTFAIGGRTSLRA